MSLCLADFAPRRLARGALAAIVLLLATAATRAADWVHQTTKEGLPANEVQFLKQDDSGDLWIGTLGGLAVWRDNKLTIMLKGDEVWDLARIAPGRYLVGTGNGIVLLEGTKATRSLTGATVGSIQPFGDKGWWAVSKNRGTERNELVEYVDGKWQAVAAFAKQKVVDLYRAADGALWVALDGDGIVAVSPGAGADKEVHHLRGFNVTAFQQDAQQRIWCGTWGRGVMVLEKGEWKRMLENEKAVIFGVRADGKGGVWVATNAHGLWQYDGAKWTNHLEDEGPVNLLETTSDGKVWISTQTAGGLRFWDGKAWQSSGIDTPLPFRCLLEARDHHLWAGNVLDGVYHQP